jgi:hypothetical protein
VAWPSKKPPGTKPQVPIAGLNLAVPYGGYVVQPGGLLQVDSNARSIVKLNAFIGCVGQLVVVNIPIADDGHFTAVRRPRGQNTVTVRIGGAFVKRSVHVTLRASGAGCDGRKVKLVGRLI